MIPCAEPGGRSHPSGGGQETFRERTATYSPRAPQIRLSGKPYSERDQTQGQAQESRGKHCHALSASRKKLFVKTHDLKKLQIHKKHADLLLLFSFSIDFAQNRIKNHIGNYDQ